MRSLLKPLFVAFLAVLVVATPALALVPGDVEWHDEVHLTDGTWTADLIEASATRVVAVGSQVTSAGDQDIRVRAYSKTGTVLWDTTFDRNGGYEFATDLIVTPKDVFIVGGAEASSAGNVDALVVRLDAKTGTVVYASWYERAGGEDAFLGADISGWRLVASGQSQSGPAVTDDFDLLIASFDTRDGSLLWASTDDAHGGFDRYNGVVLAGNVAVSAGYETGTDNYYDLLVTGHNVKTGTLLWASLYDGDGGATRGNAIAASGSTVFVVGDEAADPSTDMMIRAYEATSGALLWSDSHDVAGYYDSAYDVDVDGTVVVTTGEGRPTSGSPDMLTRAYNTTTGTLLWSDQYDLAGSVDQAWAVHISGTQAIIAGQGYDGDYEWIVRSYDLATGTLSWDDVYDRSGGSDSARDVTSLGNTVYVAGFSQEAGTGAPGSHTDATVRAYVR